MKSDTRDFENFKTSVQATALNNTGVCLNPHLVREIWESATDYDDAIDRILALESQILDIWQVQEEKAFEGRIGNL